MRLVVACLLLSSVVTVNAGWPWMRANLMNRLIKFRPPWSTIIPGFLSYKCGGGLVLAKPGHKESDVMLTSKSCEIANSKPSVSFGGVDGTSDSEGDATVESVHPVNCFKDSKDDFIVLKTRSPVQFNAILYAARLASKKSQSEHSLDAFVTGSWGQNMFPVFRTGKVEEGPCSNVNPGLPPHTALCVEQNSQVHVRMAPGTALAVKQSDGEYEIAGIRAAGEKDIFMRVDTCYDKIRAVIDEVTEIGKHDKTG